MITTADGTIDAQTARPADHPVLGAAGLASPASLYRPLTVADTVEILADGAADLLAGGTDLVPALRTGRRRPRRIIALRRVLELRTRGASADGLIIGAGVTYQDLAGWSLSPGLAATARVVGSPQIRNLGTVGGALGTADPRGDLLTFLSAADAEVVLRSVHGARTVIVPSYLAEGRDPTELITAVRLPRPCGPQVYLKVGARQAASATVVSCALVVDRVRERVACAIGGVAGRPVRPVAAEDFARAGVDWATGTAPPDVVAGFGELVAEAVRAVDDPLPDDPRASVAYRRHAAGVLAARAAGHCLSGPSPVRSAGGR
ncbi:MULTISPECIES: FAD binding domain-containing protein [Protofrankia]|uniref:Molybdopterin dehydrogenase FAD-binding protein n=1 Tax=Candidatus Protofrankia datiscae TaxID=2716812 RepID=F8B2K9_9ACTN|nr:MULTISPECIES: FAD binding domain-containing protein [Protofrankia]AEH08691.1 molybdopterin dehydrogenase FAD-binding protein [Candidatus Protofrankia datiscae]